MNSSSYDNKIGLFDFYAAVGKMVADAVYGWVTPSDAAVAQTTLNGITKGIEVSTRYRTPLLQMQQHAEIPHLLLAFTAQKKDFLGKPVTHEVAAYRAMRLGFKLLSTVLASYDKDAQNIKDFLLQYENKALLECPDLEGRGEEDEYKKQEACEIKAFLRFYTILEFKKEEKLTEENEYNLSTFFKSARLDEISREDRSMETDHRFQQEFLDYYNKAPNKEVFARSCKAVVHYSKQAEKDARHQGLLEAAKAGPDVLKAFIEKYRGLITINQHFVNQEPVSDNTKTSKTVLASTIIEPRGIEQINEVIEILTREGANIHFISPGTKTNLLHYAVSSGLWSAIPFLVEKGVKTAQCDEWDRTPLNALVDGIYIHFVPLGGSHPGMHDSNIRRINNLNNPLKALISKSIVNHADNGSYPFLQGDDAIKGAAPFFKLVVYLSRVLNIGVSETNPNQLTQRVTSQTSYNIELPIKDILELFVKNGADLNEKDSQGNTILHYLADSTAHRGYGGLVITESAAIAWTVLLKNISQGKELVSKKNNARQTPQEIALKNGCSFLKDTIQEITVQPSFRNLIKR